MHIDVELSGKLGIKFHIFNTAIMIDNDLEVPAYNVNKHNQFNHALQWNCSFIVLHMHNDHK